MTHIKRHNYKIVLTATPLWKRLLSTAPAIYMAKLFVIIVGILCKIGAILFFILWLIGMQGSTAPMDLALLVYAACLLLLLALCRRIMLYIKSLRGGTRL